MNLLLITVTLMACCIQIATTSTAVGEDVDGFQRLRQRQHRRRHREHKSQILDESDDTFEMVTSLAKQRRQKSVVKNRRPQKIGRRESRNEPLCKSMRTTVELNTQKYEFDPPFVVEERCYNDSHVPGDGQSEHTCVHGLLRCVQQYGELHVSRRSIGSLHWHPHTLPDVPISCQCMWPADKYGHIEL